MMRRLATVLLAMLALSAGVTSAQADEVERHYGRHCAIEFRGSEGHQTCALVNRSDVSGEFEALAQLYPNGSYDDAYRTKAHYLSLWRNGVRVRITNFYSWFNTGQFPSSLSTDWYYCSPPGQYDRFYAKFVYELQWWSGGPITGPYTLYSYDTNVFCPIG